MKQNVITRLLVLFIAIFLWIQQGLLRDQEEIVKIPVQFTNIPENLFVIEPENPFLPVKLAGRGLDFILMKMANVYLEVDGSRFEYGINNYSFHENNLINLDRLEVISENMNVDRLTFVELDRIIGKRKKVEIKFASSEDKDFFYKYKDLGDNLNVLIKGPQSIINTIEEIETEAVSRKMVNKGNLSFKLINPDKRLTLDKLQISLNLTQERLVNKTISLITISYPANENITIIPQKVSAMIRGPQDIIEKLDKNNVQAYLDHSDLKRIKSGKEDQVGVSFSLPSGIKLLEYTPAKIQVIRNE